MITEIEEQKQLLEDVRKHLKLNHPSELLKAFVDLEARGKVNEVVKKDFPHLSNEELKFVMAEVVGLGVIEKIIDEYEGVTDISYNGTHLDVITNQGKFRYGEIEESYIIKIIQKFANACRKEFTRKNPILDAAFSNLRLNAVHKDIAQYGTTMALRVVRPKLALHQENFKSFAPDYILDLLKAIVASKSNVTIAGETGTGKTELQKLLLSFVEYKDHIVMIEDTPESHAKILFPDKDIKSWITNPSINIEMLVKAGLRNNPAWQVVSETRGREAYEMMQGILTGHRLITTLHAVNARAIPSRLINMMKMGYDIDETSMKEDIFRYLNFGIHIEKIEDGEGRMKRYLKEIVEFLPNGEVLTVFRCDLTNKGFEYVPGKVSSIFVNRMMEKRVDIQLQSKIKDGWEVHEIS
ncbi:MULTISPECIES: CpaF/VirB11 family protein [Bacillus]|uniref:CpaF/VirB11 family protein n=1 Tax=Bacillus TaxID=1386 RepID=UPI0024C165AA|nr:CpaF/VirB11 family protein [Bacillus pumilus]WHX45908.1 CpaF/VirB11 family protein [Bacillus pumilus]